MAKLTSLNGVVPFPSTSLWNTDISSVPVDPNSANYINFIGSTVTLHPDFGAGTFHNQTIGIPHRFCSVGMSIRSRNEPARTDRRLGGDSLRVPGLALWDPFFLGAEDAAPRDSRSKEVEVPSDAARQMQAVPPDG